MCQATPTESPSTRISTRPPPFPTSVSCPYRTKTGISCHSVFHWLYSSVAFLRSFWQILRVIPAVVALCSDVLSCCFLIGWLDILTRFISNRFWLRNRLSVEWMSLGSQTSSGGELELPAMHGAGQHAVFEFGEARQVCFQVRAAALDAVAVALPELLHGGFFGVVALCVLQAFGRQAFEEVVDVLVISSLALGLEAAGEENLVDPVLFAVDDTVLQQGAVNVEAVIPLFIVPGVNAACMKIQHDLLHVAVDQHAPVDANRRQGGLLHHWLEPVAYGSQDIHLPARPRSLLCVDHRLLAPPVALQVGAFIAKNGLHLFSWQWLLNRKTLSGHGADRTRDHQAPVVQPVTLLIPY